MAAPDADVARFLLVGVVADVVVACGTADAGADVDAGAGAGADADADADETGTRDNRRPPGGRGSTMGMFVLLAASTM